MGEEGRYFIVEYHLTSLYFWHFLTNNNNNNNNNNYISLHTISLCIYGVINDDDDDDEPNSPQKSGSVLGHHW